MTNLNIVLQQQAEPVAWEHHAKKLTHWLHCMSYNDSYFGEPAGLVKQVTTELNRLIGTALRSALEQPAEPVEGNTLLKAFLASAKEAGVTHLQQAEPECWCHKCSENTAVVNNIPFSMTRMIVCPTCGNKRCPKASDHRLDCTDSNAAGQPGSVYPAPPKQQAEPVAWECKAGGLKPLSQRQYETQTANIQRHYTQIAPQRKPLTDEEIRPMCKESWVFETVKQWVRIVEAAHGIQEPKP